MISFYVHQYISSCICFYTYHSMHPFHQVSTYFASYYVYSSFLHVLCISLCISHYRNLILCLIIFTYSMHLFPMHIIVNISLSVSPYVCLILLISLYVSLYRHYIHIIRCISFNYYYKLYFKLLAIIIIIRIQCIAPKRGREKETHLLGS